VSHATSCLSGQVSRTDAPVKRDFPLDRGRF
jgi:hypothetical protein